MEKKVAYPATRPMAVNQSIIANKPGRRAENLACSLRGLQFNKFYGYERCSVFFSLKNRISPKIYPQRTVLLEV